MRSRRPGSGAGSSSVGVRAGQEIVVSGRLKRFGRALTIDNPEFQAIEGDGEVLHAGRIVPVYRLTAGLTASRLRTAMREALDRAGHAYPEYLPDDLRRAATLPGIAESLESAHYPETFERRDAALRRLAFDELLALQLGMVGRRRARGRDSAPSVEVAGRRRPRDPGGPRRRVEHTVGTPVELTADQEFGDRGDPRGPRPTDADAAPAAG